MWPLVTVGLVCIIGAGLFYGWRSLSGNSKDRPGIRQGAGGPPTLIFKVKTGKVLTPPAGKEWAVATNPMYEYWFEYPTRDWTLSIPAEYADSRARLLESKKTPGLAIVVLPFNLYDQDEATEIEKVESGYLGPHTRDSDKAETQGSKKVYWRTYSCAPPDSDEGQYAQAAFISSRPKCYVVFMRGTEADMKAAQTVFERVVKSFHLEKMPLRGEKDKPLASPAASSAPVAAGSGMPSPASAPSAMPSAAPSAASSAAPEVGASPPVTPSSGSPAPASPSPSSAKGQAPSGTP